MRVTGWHVDGFGVLSGFGARELPPGLIVFEGPNEAGKSTLLAFLRGALFGYPKVGRGKRPHYPPLAGGGHGGRVFLHTASGVVTVEREVGHGARITLEDGAELSEPEFQHLVGGVDAQTFRTVFAFSLDELSDFDSLTGEQVRSRIFAAGVGGAGPSVRQVVQDLEKTTGQLLKPRARDAQINSLLEKLAKQERALEEARVLSEQYPELLDEEESTRIQLGELDERERVVRGRVSTYEQLLDLWPIWVDLESDRSALSALEPIDEFVSDPVQRLAEVRQALTSAREALTRVEEQARRKSAQLQELKAGLVGELHAMAPAVEKQLSVLPSCRDRRHEREVALTRVRLEEERLRVALADLGGDNDPAILAFIDSSFPRIEQIRQRRYTLAEADERVKQAEERLETATVVKSRAEGERDHQNAAVEASGVPDDVALMARWDALRTLRAGLAEVKSKRAALEGREAAYGAAARLAQSVAFRSPGGRRLGLLVFGLSALGVLLACGAIVGAVLGRPNSLTAVLGGLALLALVGTGFLLWRQGRSDSATADYDPAQALQAEEAAQRRIREEIVRSEAQLLEASAVLGWDRLPDLQGVEQMDGCLAEEKHASIRWHDQVLELSRLDERAQVAGLEEQSARRRLECAAEESRSLQQEFAEELRDWGLPATLSAQGAEEYLRSVASAKKVMLRLDEERTVAARLEAEIVAWDAETARLLDQAGSLGGPAHGQDVESALLTLSDLCRKEAETRNALVILRDSLSESEVDLERARREWRQASDRWQSLLGQAGVDDEESFLRRLKVFDQRQELRRRIAEADRLLAKRIGSGPQSDSVRKTLATGEIGLWEEGLGELSRRLEECKSERSALTKLQGDTERRRRELEESTDVPSLETLVEGLRTDLASALHRWRVHTLATALVRETLAQFTRERQPAVLAEASRMFGLVTAGRYQRVLRAPDEQGIIVVDIDGRPKAPDELSRGTAEQLYLCLRLGLAEEFSRRAEPMPLVMDDVLVNFDPARRRATARLLLEFAGRHQILLFTCHPEITDLVRSEQPDVYVVDMS